jgi:cytosine/adenosine deaminase-related metal-dependent hydrolase
VVFRQTAVLPYPNSKKRPMKKIVSIASMMCLVFYSCSSEEADIIIQNVNIINVKTGDILYQKDVAIKDQYIAKIADGRKLPQTGDTRLIDGTDKYLIPGLWDMHVHLNLEDEEYLQLYLANGVTGVREMNGMHREWKEKEEGSWLAPRFFMGSGILDGPKPTYKWVQSISTEAEARQAVQEIKEHGYDFVKTLSLLPEHVYKAIADECALSGIPFAGHLPYSIHPVQAAQMGQRSAEHLLFILLACSQIEDSLRKDLDKVIMSDAAREKAVDAYHRLEHACVPTFSQSKADSLFQKLGRLEMWQCPTLIVFHDYIYYDKSKYENDPRKIYFPDSSPDVDPIEARERYKLIFEKNMELIPQMDAAGIKFLAGTDNEFRGFSLHDELQLLNEAGLSPLKTLQTATLNPAKFLARNDSMGTINETMIADLVLLDDNPLENIQNTRSINTVIYNGRICDIEKMLEDVEMFAKKESFVDTLFLTTMKTDVSTAIELYYELKKNHPDRYIFKQRELTTVAFELVQNEKLKDAIEFLKLGTIIYPESVSAYQALGISYHMDGQETLAIQNFEKVLELEPSNNDAKEMLLRLMNE